MSQLLEPVLAELESVLDALAARGARPSRVLCGPDLAEVLAPGFITPFGHLPVNVYPDCPEGSVYVVPA